MKNILLLAAYLLCQNVFAQAPEVKNLHYKFVQSSYNKKKQLVEEKHDIYFWTDSNIIVAKRKKEGDEKPWSRYMINTQKGFTAVIFNNEKDYTVYETGDLFYNKNEMEATNETKIINGYNCRLYKAALSHPIAITTSYSTLFRPKVYYTSTSAPMQYEHSIWITEDLTFSEVSNPFVLALLRSDHRDVVSQYKGVVVQLETKFTYEGKVWNTVTTLDKLSVNDSPGSVVMPWAVSSPGFAFLPAIDSRAYGTLVAPEGMTPGQYNEAMKKLLFEVVGSEKVKRLAALNTPFTWFW